MRYSALACLALAGEALAGPRGPILRRADGSSSTASVASTTSVASKASSETASGTSASTTTAAATDSDGKSKDDPFTGRYTLSDRPSACTDSSVPFETTFWAKQNQMNMVDGHWWGPKNATEWTFSTDTEGIVLTEPAWIQSGTKPSMNLQPREKGNSFTLKMDESTESQTLLFLILEGHDDPKVWNVSMKEMPEDIDKSKDVLYKLKIKGSYPCEHPIGDNTCKSNKVDMNGDSWRSYGVDSFFEDWYEKRKGDFKDKGMMQLFGSDFKAGNKHTCTIDNACSIVQSCDDLPNNGEDKDSAAIFLVWQSLQNISDMFNRMYNNLNIAQADTMTKIAQIALTYYEPIQAPTPPPNPLLMGTGILGMLSSFGGLLPGGAGTAAGAAFGAAAGLSATINSQKTTAPAAPDPQFAESDADLGVVFGNYTNRMRTHLQDIHTSLFHDGEGIMELIRYGAYVDRTSLNVDCNGCIPKAQQWLEQFLTLRMINYMWTKQNVFVTYMPYGKVIQLDSLEQTDFDIDACYSNFASGDSAYEDKTLTSCGPTGMARLTYYNKANASETKPDDDGSVNLLGFAPGAEADSRFNSTQAVDVGFQAKWAAQSSAEGLVKHGLGYNVVEDLSNTILKGGDVSYALEDLWQINATTPGMFNLPVCQIRDLNYWPSFYGQGKNRRSYNDYCICYNELNDNSPYGPSFKDYASGDLKTFASEWRQGGCQKGKGTEMAVGGSPVGLAPRASGHSDYKPLEWP